MLFLNANELQKPPKLVQCVYEWKKLRMFNELRSHEIISHTTPDYYLEFGCSVSININIRYFYQIL